ncbi:cell division cycle- protein [Coemansia sp. RSA 1722]|nr:cell division cycle- protein [Coemansia sp. RSA 1722]
MEYGISDDEVSLVPMALQSAPSTPKRLSLASDKHAPAAYDEAPSTLLRRPPSDDIGSGLMAFPRPRPSFGDDGDCASNDSRATDADADADAELPVDPRLERRRKNQYKRHGSLTLALQQSQGIVGSRDMHKTRSRLASETNMALLDDNSASSMPTPISGRYQQQTRPMLHIHQQSVFPEDTSSLAANLRSRYSHLNDSGRARSNSYSYTSKGRSRPNRDEIESSYSHLDYYIGSNADETDNGCSLFAPVNGSRASNTASGLCFARPLSATRSSTHSVITRHMGATAADESDNRPVIPSSAPMFGSHRKGSLCNNGDPASRLATSVAAVAAVLPRLTEAGSCIREYDNDAVTNGAAKPKPKPKQTNSSQHAATFATVTASDHGDDDADSDTAPPRMLQETGSRVKSQSTAWEQVNSDLSGSKSHTSLASLGASGILESANTDDSRSRLLSKSSSHVESDLAQTRSEIADISLVALDGCHGSCSEQQRAAIAPSTLSESAAVGSIAAHNGNLGEWLAESPLQQSASDDGCRAGPDDGVCGDSGCASAAPATSGGMGSGHHIHSESASSRSFLYGPRGEQGRLTLAGADVPVCLDGAEDAARAMSAGATALRDIDLEEGARARRMLDQPVRKDKHVAAKTQIHSKTAGSAHASHSCGGGGNRDGCCTCCNTGHFSSSIQGASGHKKSDAGSSLSAFPYIQETVDKLQSSAVFGKSTGAVSDPHLSLSCNAEHDPAADRSPTKAHTPGHTAACRRSAHSAHKTGARTRYTRLVGSPPRNPLPQIPVQMTACSETMAASSAVQSLALQPLPEHVCSSARMTQQPLDNEGNFDRCAEQKLSSADSADSATEGTSLAIASVTMPGGALSKDQETAHVVRHHASAAQQQSNERHRHHRQQQQQRPHQRNAADNASDRLCLSDNLETVEPELENKSDQHMHAASPVQMGWTSGHDNQFGDRVRHPTMIFDQSPILCAGALVKDVDINGEPRPESAESVRTEAVSHSEVTITECRQSEEIAREIGIDYSTSLQPDTQPQSQSQSHQKTLVRQKHEQSASLSGSQHPSTEEPSMTSNTSAMPIPRAHAVGSTDRARPREPTGASTCRNSLFPSVVKQQSRCLSVLLQQGPHGGIRRVGPLLITKERGGSSIKHLNPAFIEMMDVQPVDKATAYFLRRSNIRRRSFSTSPHDSGGDWLSAISNIIGAAESAGGGVKHPLDRSSGGPGMWWPLNDDNCSDEVVFDVHVTAQDAQDSANSKGAPQQQHTLERMASSSTLASAAGLKPPQPPSAPRKGSVSSQLRMIGRAAAADTSNASTSSGLRSNASQSSLGARVGNVPTLTNSASDASDSSTIAPGYSGRLQQSGSLANISVHSTGIQLADVTMKTETGVITRSIKSISLRLLVNRLASPEGNVDSDLMTDFLNSYRFFAHPIDVMRLIIVRYLNCFVVEPSGDEIESGSDADDTESSNSSSQGDSEDKCLTINGWCKTAESGDEALPAATSGGSKCISSRQLPPLSRNDGAIIQLRVMNIIKYWIKFHPHDFRLHHRLTRLLLLFLSHIQKQPGRADFVNSIRQKLSSGKLLAVEMPAFAGTGSVLGTAFSTAVPSQASSMRNSGVCTPTLESTRSAIDLQSVGGQRNSALAAVSSAEQQSGSAGYMANNSGTAGNGQRVHSLLSNANVQGLANFNSSSSSAGSGSGNAAQAANQLAGGRVQHAKKGSTSYFRSLFNHRSNKGSSLTTDISGAGDADSLAGLVIGENGGSVRIAQREDPVNVSSSGETGFAVDSSEAGLQMPNGNMYASDFGEVVMEALAKSGIPTPQSPVGRTLLNYSIANRNPYRINLVGIDPAMFAEQLTLLEHELFARIGATEFSLKGRVGNLETILHTMQSVGPDSRSSVSTLGNGAQAGGSAASNPVPNLTAMTSWFNQATYWAVLSVLSEPTTAARALVIKQLIHVAFHCMARRNYYGAFEIAIALDNSAVRRLHETWALVPTVMRDIVSHLLQVVQSRMNFRTYRESVKAAMSGASGPDEEMFDAIAEQIKSMRAKDMISVSQANIVTSNGLSSATATGHSSGSSGFGPLVHGSLFGADEGKQHLRKKSSVPSSTGLAKDGTALLTEQDCACIMYAIRIRAASFMFIDPSSATGGSGADGSTSGSGHSSVPVSSSKGTRGSGGTLASGNNRSNGNIGASFISGSGEAGESRSRRARSTSNSSNGAAGGKYGAGFKQGRQITSGAPLPLVPFVAVHMTDFLHADEANPTYSDEHQKMRSRNPAGSRPDSSSEPPNQRQVRCDSAIISSVNQAQPLLNMQKFRLITTMFRELHMAQRTKYPYAADMMLQQQIHSAVRNIKAQTNDIFGVVQDIAFEESLTRPNTSYAAPFARTRTGSSASRCGGMDGGDGGCGDCGDQGAFGYPLYQIAALQKSKSGASLIDASMDWEGSDIKDNQELEQRLYMLSKWIEPTSTSQLSSR